jgi:anti-sigma B factor antagonist
VPLSLQKRRVGDIIVVACSGQVIMGPGCDALKTAFDELLPHDPLVVLDVSGVDFIDSSGLGLLVRLRNRSQFAHGDLKLCGVPPRFKEVLRMTRLNTVFESHESESDAVAAFYDRARAGDRLERFKSDVLCVDQSADLLAYVCEVLKQADFGVLTATNLPDALMLLKATPPKVVVIGAALRAAHGTWASDTFHSLSSKLPVVELPADFSSHDAGDAGKRLLGDVRKAFTPEAV